MERKTFLEFIKARSPKYTTDEEFVSGKGNIVLSENVANIVQNIQVPYAIIGGFALVHHGYNRTTSDVDILVNPSDLEKAKNSLDFKSMSPITIGGVSLELKDGTAVDLLAPQQKWVSNAIKSAIITPMGKVVSAPYLILMKLWASRGGKEDVDMLQVLKKMKPEDVSKTKLLVKKYLPNEVEDLESLIMMAPYI